MNLKLAIAGLLCAVLAIGHMTIGLRWVLPSLTKYATFDRRASERLPSTPFGPPSLTLGMIRFTWQIVSLMLLGFSVLLMTIAWAENANPKTLLLRWIAAIWLAATALALWSARRRPRSLLRLPMPWLFIAIAVMCWKAST